MQVKTIDVFPRSRTTQEKINITGLTIALGEFTKEPEVRAAALKMLGSMYTKSQKKAVARANAIIAVLDVQA